MSGGVVLSIDAEPREHRKRITTKAPEDDKRRREGKVAVKRVGTATKDRKGAAKTSRAKRAPAKHT